MSGDRIPGRKTAIAILNDAVDQLTEATCLFEAESGNWNLLVKAAEAVLDLTTGEEADQQ